MTVMPNDVIRAAAKMQGPANQQIVNVYYWRFEGSGSSSDLSVMTAVQLALDEMYVGLATYLPDAQTADEIDFYNMTQGAPMGTMTWPNFTGGTALGQYLPSGIAALLSASTAVKRCLPKKFLGLMMEGDCENGEWVVLLMNALATFAGLWMESIPAGLDRILRPGTWRRLTETFTQLVSVTIKSLASYQRRRKPGVGV